MIKIGIEAKEVFNNLSRAELIEHVILNEEGILADTGALICNTGKFTGRSPKDRYIVKDNVTEDKVWWGDSNIPLETSDFDFVYNQMIEYLKSAKVYVKDAYVGADPRYRINVRVITTLAWHSLFCDNMFITDENVQHQEEEIDMTIINCPSIAIDYNAANLRQENFSIVNLTQKLILIGGTGYSGEMKKGIFSVLNFILPIYHDVFPMHCSANMGKEHNDTAIFFGLSGTGKTTLSSDTNRQLIGDDEHGWTSDGVFNYEGGCYAKTVDLTEENEPDIYKAIRYGAILENTPTFEETRKVNYADTSITKNTRVSYPLSHIVETVNPAIGTTPKHIFFLTCDAYGIIPPIQKLNTHQAMYHFVSGYTSKIAGTEEGIDEPTPVFSACFGEPFMLLSPEEYAKMFVNKIAQFDTQIWLVNTGWANGPYGVGTRTKLRHTRAMIRAAMEGYLDSDKVQYREHSVFKTLIPTSCPDVPSEILSPKECWNNDELFYQKAFELAERFHANIERLNIKDPSILEGAPKRLFSTSKKSN